MGQQLFFVPFLLFLGSKMMSCAFQFRNAIRKATPYGRNIGARYWRVSTCGLHSAPSVGDVLPTNDDRELLKIRHSAAHVMAMAVQHIFPEAKVATGPWTEHGFYYDFCLPNKLINLEDFARIKNEMAHIIKSNLPMTCEIVSREEARKRINLQNEPFKSEILEGIPADQEISIYHIGSEWWDLCAGPHVDSTGKIPIKGLDLISTSGAYWRGDASRPMLQRIYGTAWFSKDQLNTHKVRLEEAKRRDHRALGKDLDLFTIQEDAGGGLVFWHPKGSIVRQAIEDYWKQEHVNNGYQLVHTPHIANVNLWKTSGHLDFYRNDMFQPIAVEEEQFQLKPMNCPFHCLMFKDSQKSYRDLPIRWAELGTVYRYEKSGTLHGLFRVRGFTQDDAHIFCLPEQLEDEIVGVLNLIEKILTTFGFNKFDVMLSTRPKDSVGDDEIWENATNALRGALERKGMKFSVDEGGGAFYGPKIDVKIEDALGRKWQCSTVQCDFNLPQRFDLKYKDQNQSFSRPIMVHRAIFGSLERFFGVLIENSAGDFPLWLAPVQLRLLPVVESAVDYCESIKREAQKRGLRVEIDRSGNRIGKQIRTGEENKVPLLGVIGMNEASSSSVSVRVRKRGDIGQANFHDLIDRISDIVKNKKDISEIIETKKD